MTAPLNAPPKSVSPVVAAWMSCGPLIVLPIHFNFSVPRYPRSAANSGRVTAPTEPWYRSSVTFLPGEASAVPQPANPAVARIRARLARKGLLLLATVGSFVVRQCGYCRVDVDRRQR